MVARVGWTARQVNPVAASPELKANGATPHVDLLWLNVSLSLPRQPLKRKLLLRRLIGNQKGRRNDG
jgi:hypothetical protein